MKKLSSKHALLLIDLQNDFVQGGALAVPQGEQVIEVANRLMQRFELVVATQDWHPRDHRSFASQNPGVRLYAKFDLDGLSQTAWPDHCIQNTFGSEFVAGLDLGGIHHRIYKGTDRAIDSYSGFYDNGHRKTTGLSQLLRSKQVQDLVVMGLATDYCVLYSVLDAVREGFRTTVIVDGCRGVGLDPSDLPKAWASMQSAGARLIESGMFPSD
ncbi:MAG: bifunctional nicotinamidase/pyrazinamidase [Pirellula sp.]